VTTQYMDSFGDYRRKQRTNELLEWRRLKTLNMELMEHVSFAGHWIINYCKMNNIQPPNMDTLSELIIRSRRLIEQMYEQSEPTESQQRHKTTEESTEPNIFINGKRSALRIRDNISIQKL
jgi:glutaredoxin